MVSLAGGELPARGEHLVTAGRRVVQHRVHREQGNDAQHLLRAGEVWGQQDGLNRTGTPSQGRVEARVSLSGLSIHLGSRLASILGVRIRNQCFLSEFQTISDSKSISGSTPVRYALCKAVWFMMA